jgi:hypothetical protein
MSNNESRPPTHHFPKIKISFLRLGKAPLEAFKGFCAGLMKHLKGPEPQFIAHLSLRMDILAYSESGAEAKRYCIRKNGNYPSRIDSRDSLKSVTVSKPSEKIRHLISPPFSKINTINDGAIWGWTPDGVYLRVLIGDVSMLLTFEEVKNLREVLFPRTIIDGEIKDG